MTSAVCSVMRRLVPRGVSRSTTGKKIVWSAGSAPWLAGSVRAMVLDQAVTGVARWSTWWVALLFVAVLLVVLQRRGARTQALAAEQ